MSLIRVVPTEVTQCPVCSDLLEEPRQIPGCLHVFCLNCIDAVIKHLVKEGKGGVHCPLCHAEFDVPAAGASGLPTNRFVEKLIGARKLKRVLESYDNKTDSHGACELCTPEDGPAEGEEVKPATHFCFDCSQHTCKQCAAMHRKMKATAGHELIDLGAGVTEELIEKRMQTGLSVPTSCSKHAAENIKIYCRDCRQAICSMCHLEAHNGHDCADVNTVADELRHQLKDDAKLLLTEVTRCRTETSRMDRSKAEFARTIIKIQQQIGDSSDKLKRVVDDHRKRLMTEIAVVGSSRQQETEVVEKEVSRQLSALETLCRYVDELCERGTASDVAEVADSIRRRADTLRLFDVTGHVNDNVRPITLTFATSSVAAAGQGENVVGCVTVNKNDPADDIVVVRAPAGPPKSPPRQSTRPDSTVRPASTITRESVPDLPLPPTPTLPPAVPVVPVVPVVVPPSPVPPPVAAPEVAPAPAPASPTGSEERPIVSRSSAAGRPILAMTQAGNELFVVRQGGGSEIEVYEAGDIEESLLTLRRRIQIPGLGSWPTGLAASSSYLYVSDIINNSVHRVESVGMSTVTAKWRVTGGPSGLSIIDEGEDAGCLVVACTASAKIQVFTVPQGVPKYEIRLGPAKTPGLSHAVRLIGGQFAVVHSTNDDDKGNVPHGICIVVKGSEIASGAGEPEAEAGQAPKRSPSSASTSAPSKKNKYLPAILRKESSKPKEKPEVQVHDAAADKSGEVKPAESAAVPAFEGSVLLSYGDGHLKGVKSLTIDFARGRAFVADKDNNRVVIVDQALDDAKLLKFAMAPGVQLPPASGGGSAADQLVGPRSVLVDRAHGRLYVGEEAGGRLVVIEGLQYGSGH